MLASFIPTSPIQAARGITGHESQLKFNVRSVSRSARSVDCSARARSSPRRRARARPCRPRRRRATTRSSRNSRRRRGETVSHFGANIQIRLHPIQIRWFYKREVEKDWTPFMGYDSLRIELRYRHIWQTKWSDADRNGCAQNNVSSVKDSFYFTLLLTLRANYRSFVFQVLTHEGHAYYIRAIHLHRN